LSWLKLWFFTIDLLPDLIIVLWRTNFKSIPIEKEQCLQTLLLVLSWCRDKMQRWWLQRQAQSQWLYTSYTVLCQRSLSFWWSSFWWSCFWWPCLWWYQLQERFSSGAFSSDAFSFNINFFALWLVQLEPLWIRFWLWSCTLEQMFSISNWQLLIHCYHQNLEGDFARHHLFQHTAACLNSYTRSQTQWSFTNNAHNNLE